MYELELRKLGLTDGEARVYSALLSIGSSTVGLIVKKSKVSYSKIYEVLDRLIDKGLVSFIIKEKTRYYQALEPTRLHEYLDKKAKELSESQKIIDRIIPGLNELKSSTMHQEAEIFSGEKGILTAYEILINKVLDHSKLRFFYMHNPSFDDVVHDFYFGRVNFNSKFLAPIIKKKKIEWLGIVNKQNVGKNLGKPTRGIEQKYVPFPIPGNIDITDDAILITIWSSSTPLAILIQSKEVAQSFKEYFDSIWLIAKK